MCIRDSSKPAHAAAYIEHELSFEILGLKSNLVDKIGLREIAASVIQLGFVESLPLVAEAVRIIALVNKTNHSAQLGKAAAARRARIAALLFRQRSPAQGTTENFEQVGGERRGCHFVASQPRIRAPRIFSHGLTPLDYRKSMASREN